MAPKSSTKEYIETETGNKIFRRSTILGPQQIVLGGKSVLGTDCTIRGDLFRTLPSTSSTGPTQDPSTRTTATTAATTEARGPSITLGRYTYISPSAILRPPHKSSAGSYTYYPLRLGEHVLIGDGAVVQAASVGSFVQIGKGVVVGKFVVIRDHVRILEGSVVPDWAVLPAGTVWGGRPAGVVGELADGEWEGMDLRGLYRMAGR